MVYNLFFINKKIIKILSYLLVYESPENKSRYVDKILLREYSKEVLGKVKIYVYQF